MFIRHMLNYLYSLFNLILIISLDLQMKRPKYREVKQLSQAHSQKVADSSFPQKPHFTLVIWYSNNNNSSAVFFFYGH